MPTQMELLKKYRLAVRGYSGQHLLVDTNIQRKIVDLLDPKPRERILEIGPGLGALTREILHRGAKVTAVEKDGRFVRILTDEFQEYIPGSLKVIHRDILKTELARLFGGKGRKQKFKVISNLPYYITAPVLFHLIRYRSLISLAVLTMQKEVAARLMAVPGNKDYGRLTLAVRYFADIRHAFTIAPSCFTPRPEVESSVLMLRFDAERELLKGLDEKLFFWLIQVAFQQRRKTLLHILSHDKNIEGDRAHFCRIFEQLDLSPTVRGEELLIKDYMSLTKLLQAKS